MRAAAYVQVVPTRKRYGQVASLRIAKLTKNIPADPEPGALVVRIEVDVDPDVFAIPTAHFEVIGDPVSLSSLVVPVAVPQEEEEEEDDGE